MPIPAEYTFERYLSAKRSVDDRALNRYVWDTFKAQLGARKGASPLRILEIGAGIGTMVERIHEWGLTDQAMHYTAIDAEPQNIEAARQRLGRFQSPEFEIELETINLFDLLAREQGKHEWDVLIAHAFLDLIDLRRWLRSILALLNAGGLFWFTINFDGLTILEPAIDPQFDDLVMRLYHETMDQRIIDGQTSGDSRTGRHLFQQITEAGGQILAAGSSDWVVHPTAGSYPADEAYFLHFIIRTMDGALRNCASLDSDQFAAWINARHEQIERGELAYIAHQMDFLGTI